MTTLLEFRENVRRFYQRYDRYVTPASRFLLTFTAMLILNKNIGFYAKLASLPVAFLIGLAGAFLPSNLTVLLMGCICLVHIYKASVMLFVVSVLILFILYFLFARFTPELGYVILAMPVLYFLKIPYLMPLLLGLSQSPIAILTVCCGTATYFILAVIKDASALANGADISAVMTLYKTVIDNIMQNKLMLYSMAVFAVVLFITYLVRSLRINYAFVIAVGVGMLTSVIGFLIVYIRMGDASNILGMVIGTMVSAALAWAINFFQRALDYTRTENLQFEDDDYYYYVKAVPKIVIAQRRAQVKHITGRKPEGEETVRTAPDRDRQQEVRERTAAASAPVRPGYGRPETRERRKPEMETDYTYRSGHFTPQGKSTRRNQNDVDPEEEFLKEFADKDDDDF